MTWIRFDAEAARQATIRMGGKALDITDLMARLERVGDTPGLGRTQPEISAAASASVATLIQALQVVADQIQEMVGRIQQFMDAGAVSAVLPAVAGSAPGMTGGNLGSTLHYPTPTMIGGQPGTDFVTIGDVGSQPSLIGGHTPSAITFSEPGYSPSDHTSPGVTVPRPAYMMIGGQPEDPYFTQLRELQAKNPTAASQLIGVTMDLADSQHVGGIGWMNPGGRVSTTGSPGSDWDLISTSGSYEVYVPRF